MVTSHGADLFAFRNPAFIRLKKFIASKAALLTVVSDAMRSELTFLGIPKEKIRVIPMGVDLKTRFTPPDSPLRNSSEILFVGRLVEKKGLKYLFKALPEVLENQPDAHITVAGFGPELSQLELLARQLGIRDKVNFLGPVNQSVLPELYRRAAVFVAPFVLDSTGDREGLGLVLVEAAGCGCPIVVSDMPACRDVIDCGVLSITVPMKDVSGIAEGIKKILIDSRAAQSIELDALDLLRDKFDWESVSRRYAEAAKVCISTDSNSNRYLKEFL
jgi:glycosyltransferase involved in cell wall biosynthesis